MNEGTNNYGVFKLTPSDEIVSRTLQANYRNFSNVIWRTGKPALDSEWNLINDMATEITRNSIFSTTYSGWLNLGKNRNELCSNIQNTIEYYSQENENEAVIPNAIVNGWPVLIGGSNYTDSSLNLIELQPSGAIERFDFVFLEVWRAQLRSRDTENLPIAQNKPSSDYIWKFGNVQFGGTNIVDDVIDPVFNEEISERVQIQYRIRVVSGVVFTNTDSSGFEDASVRGQGGGTTPQTINYNFVNMAEELGDPGLWRAGSGNEASQVALQSVDGYSYAIPMFKIYRRSTTVYNDTGSDLLTALYNQTGNSAVMSDLVSDRPDEKFNDAIYSSDIVDLRNKISLSGFDFSKILEFNLDKLFRGQLRSNIAQKITYDSISDTDVLGYTDFLDNMGTNGKRRIWSDASSNQNDIFAEVKITTVDDTLDVYRGTGSGPWASGDTIVVKVTSKLPVSSIILSTPRIYAEDKTISNLSSCGNWTNLDTNQAIFTFNSSVTVFGSYDIWVYYDINLPAGQGISHVSDELLKVTYTNYDSFLNGNVIRGNIIKSKSNRFQDIFGHTYQNKDNNNTYVESKSTFQRKQIEITPMIQTTSIKNGPTRTLEVETLDHVAKTIYVPYPLQHLRGVYTSATGGTEIAMRQETVQTVSSIDIINNKILLSEDYFIAIITSLQYIPSGPGSEVELIGTYNPVFEHVVVTGESIGSRVSLYTNSGVLWTIPSGATYDQFKWSGTRIRVRQDSGYGYDLNGLIIDCTDSNNAGLITTMADRQQLWIDCDYFGAPHKGAELRLIYSYTPYQGSSVGGQEISLIHRREKGIFFNNGTGGGTISYGTDGTSNISYTPLSSKLPGSFNDYLRDGQVIEILSSGQKRFDSDIWMSASYDIYGYRTGGSLVSEDYIVPSMPEIAQRGFLGLPVYEVIFEEPVIDSTYAEFIIVLLVKNKVTGQLYLMLQIGNKGIHVRGEGNVFVDIFHLYERVLVK
jgi:hypothetical protein